MDEITLSKAANIKQTTKILEQMKNCVCKIHMSGKEDGTGFFTYFTYNKKNYYVFVTNYHVIDEVYVKNNNVIKISFNDEQEFKSILLDKNRMKYFSKQYDVTMLEVKDCDEIDDTKFIETDEYLFAKDLKENYKGKTIYSLQYKDVALVSHGTVRDIKEYDIMHYCSSEYGASGAPLLNLVNNKVIGINKQTATYFNKGTLLASPINDFIEKNILAANLFNKNNNENQNQNKKASGGNKTNETRKGMISQEEIIKKKNEIQRKNNYYPNNERNYSNERDYSNERNYSNERENQNNVNNNKDINRGNQEEEEETTNKTNEIIIKLNITKKDVIKKNIFFLDNAGVFKDGQYHYHEHLKELDETNTQLLINGKEIKYTKSFVAEKEGIYTVKLRFCTLIEDCSYMFSNSEWITDIDLSNFDTRHVKNMKRMFYECHNLTNINLTNFTTKNVTNMECLFGNCKNLENIDLSSFDTKKVTTMKNMFNGCKKLEYVDLSNFNTENVTSMQSMFYCCENLLSMDASSFNTSKVTNMNSMFGSCYKINEINVSSFNIENVIDMDKMFNCCNLLKSLDLSSFYFDNNPKLDKFIYGCDNCKKIITNKNSLKLIREMASQITDVKITTV